MGNCGGGGGGRGGATSGGGSAGRQSGPPKDKQITVCLILPTATGSPRTKSGQTLPAAQTITVRKTHTAADVLSSAKKALTVADPDAEAQIYLQQPGQDGVVDQRAAVNGPTVHDNTCSPWDYLHENLRYVLVVGGFATSFDYRTFGGQVEVVEDEEAGADPGCGT